MTVMVDENAVREFLETISRHAAELAKTSGRPGVLQLCVLSPDNEKMIPHRFRLDDVDGMVRTAVGAAEAGLNVYIEARTVRADLRGAQRGGIDDTVFVFGLVVDADHDKGKGGVVRVRPSLATETSPGNFHYWYLLAQLIAAARARTIGDAIRKATGADQDTGVVTQCYRVPGTPNYPSRAKQARGRTAVEPTRLVERTGRVWDPDELMAAHVTAAASATPSPTNAVIAVDESSLPDDLLKAVREGGAGKGQGDTSQSGFFHYVIGELKKRRWLVDQIHALLDKYPGGVAAKYQGRLLEEIKRSYSKVENAALAHSGAAGGGSPPQPPGAAAAPSGTQPGAAAPLPVLPTIRLRDGQLPRAVAETERALLTSGIGVFARAGALVYPAGETAQAAGGIKTIMVRLREFTTDSFIEPVAESAIFQRWSARRNDWVDIDPPIQLVRMVLSRDRKWSFPRVSGIIATPTLRADGSLLATPGYDPQTELYLIDGLNLPPIPLAPTWEQAREALALLKSLFVEFPFKTTAPSIDLSVALSGLLTALVRGSLPTAPVILVRGDTPGVGKSFLVDVIATIATGRLCPVITASRSSEETEKRIGAVLLDGSSIVSLDNLTHDLGGEILCQMAERPIVRIRVLGRSEMPDCECHTAVFGTGNNVNFTDDMVRRGLVCTLEAREERPEMREFQYDPLALAGAERARYVAAALTVMRAYLAAGAPRVCGPFGSYALWSTMARSPLVWLGEPDPVISIEKVRAEDTVLSAIREFFGLWRNYLDLDRPYTTARIIELADDRALTNFNPGWLKAFLLRVASTSGREREVSPDRLGRWLSRISGRIVDGHRLVREQDLHAKVATFRLVKV